MPFVKLDTGIVTSTLWVDVPCREVFITALLLAEPYELTEAAEQIEVRTLNKTGFQVPPGWYGFVRAAGIGIIGTARIEVESGMVALEKLGSPDLESRSSEFDGRRLVRVNGGFLLLNYMKYREKDHGAAQRMRLLRQRKKQLQGDGVTANSDGVTANNAEHRRTVTYADADADADKTLTPANREIRTVEPSKPSVPGFEPPTEHWTDQGTPTDLPPESLAHKVIEVFHLNNAKNILVAIAGAIRAMAGEKGIGIAEGCDALIEVSTRAQAAGASIEYLWFLNTGWRKWEAKQVKAAEPKKRPKSPAEQLREQEAEVARDRAAKAGKS